MRYYLFKIIPSLKQAKTRLRRSTLSSGLHLPFSRQVQDTQGCCPGGGGTPYKSDGGARRKISRTPLKGTRVLFYGRVSNSFPPLRGTNSGTTNFITGTANFKSNREIFRTLSSQVLS